MTVASIGALWCILVPADFGSCQFGHFVLSMPSGIVDRSHQSLTNGMNLITVTISPVFVWRTLNLGENESAECVCSEWNSTNNRTITYSFSTNSVSELSSFFHVSSSNTLLS